MSGQSYTITITISGESTNFFMGEEINLFVTLKNETQNRLSLRDPLRTWEYYLRVTDSNNNVDDVHFGKKIYVKVKDDFIRATIEEAETIELKPESQYTFVDNILKRWPEVFIPGNLKLQVVDETDDNRTIYSNEVQLKIIFTEKSVPVLLNMTADTTQRTFYRNWAMKWLQQLKPDFKLKLPNEEEEEVISEDDESYNSKQIKVFEHWWIESKNSKKVGADIEQINKKYFEEIKD